MNIYWFVNVKTTFLPKVNCENDFSDTNLKTYPLPMLATGDDNSMLYPLSAHFVNNLFVTTDMEFSSAPVTVQPSGPIHPPVLIPTQSPSSGHGPELYGSGFVLQDDPATSHSLDSIPGGREGKARREAASMLH